MYIRTEVIAQQKVAFAVLGEYNFVCMYIYICVCVFMRIYVYVYVYMYIYKYICIYIYHTTKSGICSFR
jgi:hypothetical protein